MPRLGIAGATGVVGQELLSLIHETNLPVTDLKLAASQGSAGRVVDTPLGPRPIMVMSDEFFSDLDFCFFCVSPAVSRKWIPMAISKDVVCVDNSSAFRMDAKVPIIVPEVNGSLLASRPRLIANPNCSVAQLTVALAPIKVSFGLAEVSLATYQSVSGAGYKALDSLERQIHSYCTNGETAEEAPILFNIIPFIGSPEADGHYQEELKIVNETRKVLALPALPIAVTAARVPVFRGHCQAVSFVTEHECNIDALCQALAAGANIKLENDLANDYHPQPVRAAKTNRVYIGRIRKNSFHRPNSYSMWVVADNLRKGAAHNALNIVEAWCDV